MAEESDYSTYDFRAILKGTKEERLKIISDAHAASKVDRQRAWFEGIMFADSSGLDEHPEWFSHGCACNTCLSYGEEENDI